jgi:chromosome segregation ATPase
MMKHYELKEYMDEQMDKKDKLENEMLEEGDKITDLLLMKEKLELERELLMEQAEDKRDEGRLLEIDDNLKDIALEVESITQTLDMLEQTLSYVQSKVNQVTEEIEAFDDQTVTPLQFNALTSIESAKATLKTFF